MNYQKGRFLKVCQGPGQRSLLEQDVAREQGGEVREPFTFDSAGIHTLWQIFLGPRGPLRVPMRTSGETLCRDNCQLIGMPFFHTRLV